MRSISFILIVFLFSGCNSSDEELSSISLSASGLNKTVTLRETISGNSYEITQDGIFILGFLAADQKTYELNILNSQEQSCRLEYDGRIANLLCNGEVACTAVYQPVCAKQFLPNLQCVTSPCATYSYETFSNACTAQTANATVSFDSECGGLEDFNTFEQEPAVVVNLSLFTYMTDPFTVISSKIEDDILSIKFEVSGGCGSHNFDLYVNDTFAESSPVQLNYGIAHIDQNDPCDGIVVIDKEFDLLAIKEFYKRAYPNAQGAQSVVLPDLGTYNFVLD